MTPDYDVIIIGGGPAGAGTATHLAREGFAVLLLDRAQFPRDKPCGEFFSPPVRSLLTRLGAYDAVRAAGISDIPAAKLHTVGAVCAGRFDTAQHQWASAGGFSLERRVLDAILWENAENSGAKTRSGCALRGLLRNVNGHICGVQTGQGTFTSRVVVGADGSKSRVAREMNVVRPIPRLQKIAVVSHYAVPGAVSESGTVEMHIAPLPDLRGTAVCGVGWGPNGIWNVTLTTPETESRSLAARGVADYVEEVLRTAFPAVSERLRGATRLRSVTCGTFGHRTTTPITDGALLVGDAATFIDPFTGEGVYFALRGAELAAEALTNALRRNDLSRRGLAAYATARRRELVPKYAVCAAVEHLAHQPRFMRWATPRLQRRPVLLDALLSVTGDMAHPVRLAMPDFLWGAITA